MNEIAKETFDTLYKIIEEILAEKITVKNQMAMKGIALKFNELFELLDENEKPYYDEQNQKYWDKWFSRNQTEILTAENKEILNEMYLGGGIMSKYRMNFFLEDGYEEFIEEEAVYED